MMHYMGWRAYEKENSIASAFMNSSELCDSGMYHGVAEGYLRKEGMNGNIGELIKDVCPAALEENPALSEGTKSLCYHGLGHGLMYVTKLSLQTSLDYCDLLGKGANGSCYSGVFMENKLTRNSGVLSTVKSLDDFEDCLVLKEHQKGACYVTQGMNYLSLANGDVGVAMRSCGNIQEQERYNCFIGVGSNTPTPGRSHADSAIACRGALEVSEVAYQACIDGGLGFVAQIERGNPEGAFDFCEATTEKEKGFCFFQMGEKLSSLSKRI